mgnify:FL=1
MNITSASQQFAVAEQNSVAFSRKQQLQSNQQPAFVSRKPASPTPESVTTTPVSNAVQQDDLEADDEQLFNAYQTVGMVKRILAQLSSHTADWLERPLVAEFSGRELQSASFSASYSEQSIWLSQQTQTQDEQQRILSETWEFGYQAVQASFNGALQLDDGSSISFAFDFSMEISWARYSAQTGPVQDPLLVSLTGQPVALTDDSTNFDLQANGQQVALPQLSAEQYYLAYDRNQDQQVNNGTELFGPISGNGFADLAAFDSNANGFIEATDDIWQHLYLWRPQQRMLNISQSQLAAISLESVATPMPLLNKEQQVVAQLQRSGLAFFADGTPALVQQIDIVA